MKVILLGLVNSRLRQRVRDAGDDSIVMTEDVNPQPQFLEGFDALVTFRYPFLLRPPILALFPGRAFNLHISLLPWNRGADPNLWSFLERTPKGVSIHLLEEGLDTGDVVAQREVPSQPEDTLRTSYDRLTRRLEALFCEVWPRLRSGDFEARPQVGRGSYHRAADKDRYLGLLRPGWDTPVAELEGRALEKCPNEEGTEYGR